MILLYGDVGAGKSTALRAIEGAPPLGWRAVYVPVPTLDFPDVASWCLERLGEPPPRDAISALRDSTEHARLLILIDDAEQLPAETAHALLAFEKAAAQRAIVVAACARAERSSPPLLALGPPAREIEVEPAGGERASAELRAQFEFRKLEAPRAPTGSPATKPEVEGPVQARPKPLTAPQPRPAGGEPAGAELRAQPEFRKLEAPRAPTGTPAPKQEAEGAGQARPKPLAAPQLRAAGGEPAGAELRAPPEFRKLEAPRVPAGTPAPKPEAEGPAQARLDLPAGPQRRTAPPLAPAHRAGGSLPPPTGSPRSPVSPRVAATPAPAAMAPSESWPPEGRPPAPRVVPLWLAGLGAATAFLLPVAFFSGFLLGRWQPSASPVLARESSAELPAVSAAPPPAAAERARPDESPPSPSPEPSTSAAAAASRPEDPAPGDAEPGAELDFASRAAAAIDTLLGRRPTPSASSEVAVVVPGSPPDPAPVSTARRERRRRPSEPPVEDWGAPQLLSVEPPSEGP